ncbi:MAG: hypothetical protein IJM64_09020 [Ottowia sp.]|nr:hypothetical protein [Ottowia sp.]
MNHIPSPFLEILVLLGILVLGAPLFLDAYADRSPSSGGKTLYRASALLAAIAAAALFAAHCAAYWHHPLEGLATVMGALFIWIYALQAASSACKARLGARLKRGGYGKGKIIGFYQTLAHQDEAVIKAYHPRHWLPFYQPWVLYEEGKITGAELAAALLASLAIAALPMRFPYEFPAMNAFMLFFCLASALDFFDTQMERQGHTQADICFQKKIIIAMSIPMVLLIASMAFVPSLLFPEPEKLPEFMLVCTRAEARKAAKTLIVLESGGWFFAAAVCCQPFFILRLYHEFQRGRALRAAGVQRTPRRVLRQKFRQRINQAQAARKEDERRVLYRSPLQTFEKVLIGLLGGACAVASFLLLHMRAAGAEILVTAFCLIFYGWRKLAWFLLFQNIQPFWKDWHAWRAAYLRARASWLLEWMMAALAPAPLLRFLSFRASPDTLERAGANLSLALAIFLCLPLALRLWQKARPAL